jgi:hypothetical protein
VYFAEMLKPVITESIYKSLALFLLKKFIKKKRIIGEKKKTIKSG